MATAAAVAPLLFLCFLFTIVSVYGLTCWPCQGVVCPSIDTYDCPSGVVKSGCECCHECAKEQGEKCGGSFDVFGKCAEGLVCVRQVGQEGRPTFITWEGVCLTPQQAESSITSSTGPPRDTPLPASTTTPRTSHLKRSIPAAINNSPIY
ncbi:hypothetical protein OTU49_006769 [Cherax quadricarinatus]|uniref:IGFBP N-terminal domain-containing protein n=1 Tax=Cherax quadricarinatus TaxID=27406 RepID=A0AAW0X0C0_CHEQU|nr:single insulin-like growth factor-binding domain protein-2 isoform X1 [Cherax quadricarinatus]